MIERRLVALVIALAVAIVALNPTPVLAWGSQCGGLSTGSPDELICEEAGCDTLVGPHYRLLGEHALIARQAMELVGLRDYADDPVLQYLGAGGNGVGVFPSLEPGAIGQMTETVWRPTTVPEFSQLPDVSYGLADFILGNEHCFLQHTQFGIRNAPQICHNYVALLGPLNSTHFPPQARAVYQGYHRLALDTAARCRELAEAVENMSASIGLPESAPSGSEINFPNEEFLRDEVLKRCELEALAIEAVATHYSSDAWSMGHMWERWGAPVLARSGGDQARQWVVALLSGLIHGARDVLGKLPDAVVNEHDQMNAPGPWVPETGGLDLAKTREVRFHSGGRSLPGAGDGYLLECTSRRPIDDPDSPLDSYSESMESSPNLQETKSLMLSCVARGFQEVYEAGPRTGGDLPLALGLHPAIPSSLSDGCWNLRADNLSMWLGAGISSIPASRDPAFWRGVNAVAGVADLLFELSAFEELERLGRDMVALHTSLALRALLVPGGEQSASMPPPLLGLSRNSLAVSQIKSGDVAQLDKFDRDAWAAAPRGVGGCDDDAECAPNEYCQIELDSDGTELRSCVEKEVSILRAFRRAELQTWCEASEIEDLQRAAALCQGSLGADCDACAELVLPHMRNACDAGSYDPEVTGRPALLTEEPPYFDHRSMCDIASPLLGKVPPVLYAAYDPAEQGTALAAALSLCESGFIATDPIEYDFDEEPPPSDEALGIDEITLNEERSTCGAAGKVHWFRLTHDANLTHVHQLLLTPSPLIDSNGQSHTAEVDKLTVDVFSGEDCVTAGPSASLRDTNQDGLADAWAVPWGTGPAKPNEICIRVTASEYDSWTNYALSEATEDVGSELFTVLDQLTYATAKVTVTSSQHVEHSRHEFSKCDIFGWRTASVEERAGEPSVELEDWGPECVAGFSVSLGNLGASGTYATSGASGTASATADLSMTVGSRELRLSGGASGSASLVCDSDQTTYCPGVISGTGNSYAQLNFEMLESADVEISWNTCGDVGQSAAYVGIVRPGASLITVAGHVSNDTNPAFGCAGFETTTFFRGTQYHIRNTVDAAIHGLASDEAGAPTEGSRGSWISVVLRPIDR